MAHRRVAIWCDWAAEEYANVFGHFVPPVVGPVCLIPLRFRRVFDSGWALVAAAEKKSNRKRMLDRSRQHRLCQPDAHLVLTSKRFTRIVGRIRAVQKIRTWRAQIVLLVVDKRLVALTCGAVYTYINEFLKI